MPTVGGCEDCSKCGCKGTLEWETRHDEYREECSHCGFYCEYISEYFYKRRKTTIHIPESERLGEGFQEISGKCVEIKDVKLLEGFKKDERRGKYIRKGMIKKKEENKGRCELVNRWYSSPNFINVEVVWDDDPAGCDEEQFPTEGDGWSFHSKE